MSADSFLSVTRDSGITVVEFGPRSELIEEPILEPLTRELLAATSAAKPPVVLLDLSRTTFFGSGFLETLLRVWKGLQSRPESKMSLCGLHPYCREVLEITHLDKMWPIYDSRAEAITGLTA